MRTTEPSGESVLVSACLAGVACRYDGGALPDDQIMAEVRLGRAVPVCAEEMGGLATPREPAEIVGGSGADVLDGSARVVTVTGRDITAEFVRGAEAVLARAREVGATRAVLKSNSPSCGRGLIYDGTHSGRRIAGDGVTTALLLRHGIRVEPHDGGDPES